MRSKPLGKDGRDKDILLTVGFCGSGSEDCDLFFHAVFVRSHFRHTERQEREKVNKHVRDSSNPVYMIIVEV
jgi:hypothetical protein